MTFEGGGVWFEAMVQLSGEGYKIFGCGIVQGRDDLLSDCPGQFKVNDEVRMEGFGRIIGLDIAFKSMLTVVGLIVAALGRIGSLEVLT